MAIKVCAECGREFKVQPSRIAQGRGRFCSKDCRIKWFSKNKKYPQTKSIKKICPQCKKEFETKYYKQKFCSKECMAKAFSKKERRICKQCQKEFWVRPSRIKAGGGVFCSNDCAVKWVIENMSKREEKICPICNKKFFVVPSRIKKGEGIYCSQKCASKALTKNNREISVADKIRESEKYEKWRFQIFTRDNFTCQKCGAKGI
jgi:DNA-directed RNA polymerase subunit RPC12/RpoP